MSATDAELTMQKYINNSKFFVAKEGALWGPGLYISSNFSNHQCKIQIREEKVTDIDAVFD
jgi:hypothetical protein